MISYYQRKAVEKYHRTPKGREALKKAQRKYETTRKAKLRAERYAASSKGKETMAACRARRKTLKSTPRT